jgi:hypothetical protein
MEQVVAHSTSDSFTELSKFCETTEERYLDDLSKVSLNLSINDLSEYSGVVLYD